MIDYETDALPTALPRPHKSCIASARFFHLQQAVEQSGAVEACWAHNPEVRRSKLRSAKIFSFHQGFFLPAFLKKVSAAECFGTCRNPGLNQGPLDLQSNALPTELFRPTKAIGGGTNPRAHMDNGCISSLKMPNSP